MDRFVLPGESVFPEGITEGPGSSFFVGSLGDGTLYRGSLDGSVEVWLGPDGDGRSSIAGLDIDADGRLLACDIHGGELFAYSLDSRALVERQRFPAEGSQPNDVVVVGDVAYVTDTKAGVVWRVLAGEEPSVLADLEADDLYLNGIVALADGSALLVAAQGTGDLWRISLPGGDFERVDLGGYEFNADGMLLDGDVLYGVTNRGESWDDVTFAISAFRLSAGGGSGTLLGELTDPAWNCPTTIAAVDGRLLVVCSQLKARQTGAPVELPFEVAALDLPEW